MHFSFNFHDSVNELYFRPSDTYVPCLTDFCLKLTSITSHVISEPFKEKEKTIYEMSIFKKKMRRLTLHM